MEFSWPSSKTEIFLFDSFGFDGFKGFLLQDDKKTVNKILYGIKKFPKKDSKITVITLTFSMEGYKKIKTVNDLVKQRKIYYIL